MLLVWLVKQDLKHIGYQIRGNLVDGIHLYHLLQNHLIIHTSQNLANIIKKIYLILFLLIN
ncbi:hypothetical protein ABR34_23000 [Citrobacter braakii]|nr:hypothetical protein ABR34_23000 [Citrobacter braakii]